MLATSPQTTAERETSPAETTDLPLKTYNVTRADARPELSEHHKITFDEKRTLVPWEEGKTSQLYVFPCRRLWIEGGRKEGRDRC